MKLGPPVFSHLVHKLKALADGKLAVILEGGYHWESLAESVGYSLRALLDDCCSRLAPTQAVQPEYVSMSMLVSNVQTEYVSMSMIASNVQTEYVSMSMLTAKVGRAYIYLRSCDVQVDFVSRPTLARKVDIFIYVYVRTQCTTLCICLWRC